MLDRGRGRCGATARDDRRASACCKQASHPSPRTRRARRRTAGARTFNIRPEPLAALPQPARGAHHKPQAHRDAVQAIVAPSISARKRATARRISRPPMPGTHRLDRHRDWRLGLVVVGAVAGCGSAAQGLGLMLNVWGAGSSASGSSCPWVLGVAFGLLPAMPTPPPVILAPWRRNRPDPDQHPETPPEPTWFTREPIQQGDIKGGIVSSRSNRFASKTSPV